MNALDQTAFGIASALTGRKRADQHVHVCRSHFRAPFPTRHIVLVDGEYYEVFGIGLAALQSGMTPEELELDPYEEDDL